MAHTRAALCSVPQDVLDEVAYHLALSDRLGPPVHLIALLCTCKHLYASLSRQNNVHLYARIFAAKFDSGAALRRMGDRASHSAALASQLPKYCKALRNIRRGDIDSPSITRDLLRAFAMCLENDGMNAAQLEWAGLFEYVEHFILEHLWDTDHPRGWPMEEITNSLALWLYWYSSSEERFASKTEEERRELMALIRPYALYNFRYPPFLAPDNHAHLPLPGCPEAYRDHSTVTPHGFYPLYRDPKHCKHTLRHYSRTLTLAEPPIGLIAKLLYIALQEFQQIDVNQPIPDDRAEAIQLGARGPTRADYIEFARTKAARYPVRGNLDFGASSRNSTPPSMAHDIDWARWRRCYDPWAKIQHAPHAMYVFGSLTGHWAGRSLDPDGHEYAHATNARDFDAELAHPERLDVTERPLFFTLREHRARPRPGSSGALPYWEVHPYRDPLNEGIMNAYFPRGWPTKYAVVERDGTLSISLRGRGKQWVYDTYVPGAEGTARKDSDGSSSPTWPQRDAEDVEMADEDSDDARVGRARREVQEVLGASMDVDELIDAVASGSGSSGSSSRSSSVSASGSSSESDEPELPRRDDHRDIILTGETQMRHALAWGDYRLYGRVRHWDGLVVIIRAPAPAPDVLSPVPDALEPAVFRGYLVGGANLVGAWRHITDSIHTIPVEGPFVVSKVVEQKAARA